MLLTGPRPVGKTTMLKKLLEWTKRGYVSSDDLDERTLAITDPELFLGLHKPPVLIDEAQHAPELFTYVKIYADSHDEPGTILFAGSESFSLMRGIRESLAGRAAVLSLAPLSQAEICGTEASPLLLDIESLEAKAS